MVGIIIGIVAVIGLVAVTITFLIKGKEAKAKVDENLKEINDVLRDLRNKKIYYVEKTEFNVLKNDLYRLELRINDIEKKIEKIDSMKKDINLIKNVNEIETIKKDIVEIKKDIETNRQNIDDIDDFVAITVD